tara:strand:- start:488 stop:1189 length:702 start_codon:yes stop_codon:yes gene_type:complete
MGINSTEVSYGFGQLGSVFTNLAKPVFPPKDHVIIAIQFLADNTLSVLETETLDSMGPQFITHQDDELASAGGPDANFAGVVWAATADPGAGAYGTAAGVITIADLAKNTLIKKGQIVLIGDDAAETIDTGIATDTAAGHVDPVYNGPNKKWLEVESITGGTYGTTIQLKAVGGASLDVSGLDAANQIYFLDSFHGAGGTTVEGVTFPIGTTIYGRWSTVTPGAAPVICYFGK